MLDQHRAANPLNLHVDGNIHSRYDIIWRDMRTDDVIEEGDEAGHDGGEDNVDAAPDNAEGRCMPDAQAGNGDAHGRPQNGSLGEQSVHPALKGIEEWLRPHLCAQNSCSDVC